MHKNKYFTRCMVFLLVFTSLSIQSCTRILQKPTLKIRFVEKYLHSIDDLYGVRFYLSHELILDHFGAEYNAEIQDKRVILQDSFIQHKYIFEDQVPGQYISCEKVPRKFWQFDKEEKYKITIEIEDKKHNDYWSLEFLQDDNGEFKLDMDNKCIIHNDEKYVCNYDPNVFLMIGVEQLPDEFRYKETRIPGNDNSPGCFCCQEPVVCIIIVGAVFALLSFLQNQ